jgi:small-conductance mechanosensitive channel
MAVSVASDLWCSYPGLSWLIGGSLQEVLQSIVFLFVKHPFDVGDSIVLAKENYTVKEIRLLSTVFIDANGTMVQAPNNVLNTMVILTWSYLEDG